MKRKTFYKASYKIYFLWFILGFASAQCRDDVFALKCDFRLTYANAEITMRTLVCVNADLLTCVCVCVYGYWMMKRLMYMCCEVVCV